MTGEPEFDTTPAVTPAEAAELAVALDERLKAPMIVLLDGLVRELSEAHNAMMQSPGGAGEQGSNKYGLALHHVMVARGALRGH